MVDNNETVLSLAWKCVVADAALSQAKAAGECPEDLARLTRLAQWANAIFTIEAHCTGFWPRQ